MDRKHAVGLALTLLSIACFVIAGYVYLQAAASYSLSFSYCTEPGTANEFTDRCQRHIWLSYLFWGMIFAGVVFALVAIVRGRRARAAAP